MNIILIVRLIDKQQNQIFPNQQQSLEQFESPAMVIRSSVGALPAMRVAPAREVSRKGCKKNHENCLAVSQTRN